MQIKSDDMSQRSMSRMNTTGADANWDTGKNFGWKQLRPDNS